MDKIPGQFQLFWEHFQAICFCRNCFSTTKNNCFIGNLGESLCCETAVTGEASFDASQCWLSSRVSSPCPATCCYVRRAMAWSCGFKQMAEVTSPAEARRWPASVHSKSHSPLQPVSLGPPAALLCELKREFPNAYGQHL